MMGRFSWPTPAHGGSAAGRKAGPSFYRYKVGDTESVGGGRRRDAIQAAADLRQPMHLPDEVKKALEANFVDTELFNNTYTPIVVNTGKNLVVIDTGLGEAGIETSKGTAGNFLNNLAAAGIDPNNVDTVIISHFHGDHVNGLLRKDNSVAFPNAAIKVPAQEQKFWMDDGEMSKAAGNQRMGGLFKNNRRIFGNAEVAKRVQPYEAGKEIVPGITGGRNQRPFARAPLADRLVGRQVRVRAGRRDARAVPVRAQSGLASDVRPGPADGRSHAAQGL